LRPAEVDALVGDSTKARQRLRWSPSVDFHGLVRMMVDADLARLTRGAQETAAAARPA
jgi:GDPmannose 4,6-dehydratase